ncbi:MAG TPA: nuclear transport factor 2 family protein [Gaiellales bacterium]|nr:nuclear transport factor 2 family protein [Gaiellales bacterium]
MTTETSTMSDVAVVRAGFEAFAGGDVAGFANMFAADATWNHRNPDRLGGIHQGVDGIMAFIGESAQLTAGTLRAEPLAIMSDGAGSVAVRVRVSAIRPDGRAFADLQILLFRVEGDHVAAVDQYVGDPPAVTAFWA